MIRCRSVALRRGPRLLLDQLDLTIHLGQKVGIVGRNGTGKTSLFAMILGELAPDAGDFTMPRDLRIATVAQETPALTCAAIDHVLDGDQALRRVQAALERAQADGNAAAIANGHEQLHALDGYTATARAATLLDGLGFAPDDAARPVREFSGGWRVRLNLARALMCPADLLLLDEPTNHLDLDAVLWLQEWLSSFAGTLLLISHDRDFLDAVSTHTLQLEGGRAQLYSGNYSQAERIRAERLAQQAASYAAQQQRAAHLQKYIDRFRAKATKARQAQSRIKQLDRMVLEAPAHWDSPFSFEFATPKRLGSPLIRYDDAALGYGDTTLLAGLRFSLEPGDRIGLLGRNGAGKSSLIRSLAGNLQLQAGKAHRDPHLNIGYFAQHQLEQLDPTASPLLHLRRLAPEPPEQQLRDFLGGFDFRGDQVFDAVAPFSGGEKARLALALVAWRQPNLLLLDEPSNHLDLEMRHALEVALQEFAGAVVLVSHDRHLLDTCCDQLWLVADGRCQPYAGDLDDYARWLRQRRGAPAHESKDSSVSRKDQRREAAAKRASQEPLRRRLAQLEQQVAKLQAELSDYEQRLADPALYADPNAKPVAIAIQQGQCRSRLQVAEEQWLELAEELEQDSE